MVQQLSHFINHTFSLQEQNRTKDTVSICFTNIYLAKTIHIIK